MDCAELPYGCGVALWTLAVGLASPLVSYLVSTLYLADVIRHGVSPPYVVQEGPCTPL